jgi:hemolysin activation/secretion protein
MLRSFVFHSKDQLDGARLFGVVGFSGIRRLGCESKSKLPGVRLTALVVWTCLALCALNPLSVRAQTQADIDAAKRQAETIQRVDQERLLRDQEEARRRTDRVDGMDTKKLLPKIETPAIGAPCRDISVIEINGGAKLSTSVRKHISADFTGRCLAVGDIERILAEITKDYIDRGFVTARAYLPAQDLSKGRLEILVVEGVVNKVSIDDGGANSVSVDNVFPRVEGSVLNLRDLEQGIDQINRLSSNSAQLDIQPGESVVVVHNRPSSRFHFNISTDNQGSESTGDVQTGLTVTADNLLGINDMLSATHRESTPGEPGRKFSGSDNLNFSVPFGYNSLSVGVSQSRYASTIKVPSGLELVSSGTNKSNNVRLDRVVYRDQSTRATLAGTITAKDARNYLDGQFLGVSSRSLSVFDLDANLNTGFAGGVLTLDLGYAQGLDDFGALRDPSNLPDTAPRAQFSKTKAGFNFSRPFQVFGLSASVTSQLTAQKANNTLYGSEQISIGGIYSVRGFVRNTLSGDDGYYLRNEFSVRRPLVVGSETVGARFYVGYDTGEVSNRVQGIPQGRLDGMVVGLSANWRGATFDLFNTQALTLPDTMTKESSQTWARVAYSF